VTVTKAMERFGQAVVVLGAFVTWEFAARAGLVDAALFSFPTAVLVRTVEDLLGGGLLVHVAITLSETVSGFFAGAVAGIACALLFVRFTLLRLTLMPFLSAFYAIPRPALAPLFVLWFGVGFASKLVLVVTLVYFVFLLHVIAGVQGIDRGHVNWVRTLGASRAQVLRTVGIPHLLPWLFASTKLGLALALIGAIVGEIISSRAGLGFIMMHAAHTLDTDGVMSGIFVLSLIVVAIVLPLGALERRLFRWHVESRV